MKQAKLFFILVLAVFILIVVLQNTQEVETKILFMTIVMPRAMLLILTAAIGFILGILVTLFLQRKQGRHQT